MFHIFTELLFRFASWETLFAFTLSPINCTPWGSLRSSRGRLQFVSILIFLISVALTDIHGFEKPGPPGSFLKSLWFSLLDPICKYKLVQLLLRPDRRAWRAGVYNIKAGTFRELQCIYR